MYFLLLEKSFSYDTFTGRRIELISENVTKKFEKEDLLHQDTYKNFVA